MNCCCCFGGCGCTGGGCNCACCCFAGTCADKFCGGCLTGCNAFNVAAPCSPVSGQDVPICALPLTNPSNDPSLDPITSPCSDGTTDPPPATCACHPAANRAAGGGGGSGAGGAKSSQGGLPIPRPAACANQNKLLQMMSQLGSTLASLGTKTAVTPTGQKIVSSTPSNIGFMLVAFVVGALLLMMVFGKMGE